MYVRGFLKYLAVQCMSGMSISFVRTVNLAAPDDHSDVETGYCKCSL